VARPELTHTRDPSSTTAVPGRAGIIADPPGTAHTQKALPITTEINTTPTNSGPRSPRRPRRGRRAAAPVTIVQAAVTPATPLTRAQCQRRSNARWLAANLTEAARRGVLPSHARASDCRVSLLPQTAAILRDAPSISATPPPGALQIGRDHHGRAVAVVLHAPAWSLVIRPPASPGQPPVSWAYLDGFDLGRDVKHMDFCFDDDCSVAGVEWSDMLAAILAATT
jgi:hypothetical protein